MNSFRKNAFQISQPERVTFRAADTKPQKNKNKKTLKKKTNIRMIEIRVLWTSVFKIRENIY